MKGQLHDPLYRVSLCLLTVSISLMLSRIILSIVRPCCLNMGTASESNSVRRINLAELQYLDCISKQTWANSLA